MTSITLTEKSYQWKRQLVLFALSKEANLKKKLIKTGCLLIMVSLLGSIDRILEFFKSQKGS
jgi:hypothetical protein